MRYVYLVERGQLNKVENKFNFYDTEIFSSRAKAEKSAINSIDVNKGWDVVKDDMEGVFGDYTQVDYKCFNCEGDTEMTLRIVIRRKELK
jgi:hypothetical protein